MEVYLHVFLTSALDGGEWLTVAGAGLEAVEKRKILPLLGIELICV
jgi:hypothetical protein